MNAALPISTALVPGQRESLGSSAGHGQRGFGVQSPLNLVIYLENPVHYMPSPSVIY